MGVPFNEGMSRGFDSVYREVDDDFLADRRRNPKAFPGPETVEGPDAREAAADEAEIRAAERRLGRTA